MSMDEIRQENEITNEVNEDSVEEIKDVTTEEVEKVNTEDSYEDIVITKRTVFIMDMLAYAVIGLTVIGIISVIISSLVSSSSREKTNYNKTKVAESEVKEEVKPVPEKVESEEKNVEEKGDVKENAEEIDNGVNTSEEADDVRELNLEENESDDSEAQVDSIEEKTENGLVDTIVRDYRNIIQRFLDNELYLETGYEALTRDDLYYDVMFSLKDLNQDGMDELLLIQGTDPVNVFIANVNHEESESCDIAIRYYDEENKLCISDIMSYYGGLEFFELHGEKKEVRDRYELEAIDEDENLICYHTDANGNVNEISEDEYWLFEQSIPLPDTFEKYEITDENLDKYLPLE